VVVRRERRKKVCARVALDTLLGGRSSADVRRQTVTPQEFHDRMTQLLDSLCERRALDPLRIILPHWPIRNPFTEDWSLLGTALKTARMQLRDRLSEKEMELVISLQHAAESALEGKR
jgi:hypothetical protein